MSEQETDAVGADQSSALPGPSELLRTARENLQMTQKEVADKLFLTTSFIQYIDDGEFDRFPKQAFVKGYLRTYARVVGLSGDEIVALYAAELEASAPDPEIRGVTEEKVGTAAITGPVLQSGLIGLAGLIVVILLIWYLVSDDDEGKSVPRVKQPAVGAQDSGPKVNSDFDFVIAEDDPADADFAASDDPAEAIPATLIADQIEDGETTAAIEGVDETAVTRSSSPSDEQDAAESRALQADVTQTATPAAVQVATGSGETDEEDPIRFERTSDGDRSVIKVDAGGYDQLVMSFSDECWVEVSDSARGLVYNDLNRPSDMLTVYGSAPFNVLLGKATGVEMIYNGRPFDLARHTARDSTAKFTVAD